MGSFLRPGRNGTATATSAAAEVSSLTEDLAPSPNRLPVTSDPSGRLSQEQASSESPETTSINVSLTINGTGAWAPPPDHAGSSNGGRFPSLAIEEPTEPPDGQLVDGVSSNSQSSEDVLAPQETRRHLDVNHLESQTPAPTNPTPGATTPRLSLPPSSTDQSHHGFPSEIGQNPPPGGSTAFNSQLDQPPESPRRNRRRRRFVQWIRRRFRYHGPWVPGMQRNRNNVSNPIARVDRVFPQSS